MEELAPEAVGVAAGFGAPREKGFRPYRAVVAAVAVGQMGIAPTDVENLERRVCVGLAAGTERTT